MAADYRLGVLDHSQLYKTNVEGTRNLLAAATRAGIKKIVYTSSVATMGIPGDGSPGDERTAVSSRGHDRPLQAIEVPRRAGGTRSGARRRAGGHRQSVDAGRTGRCEAHATGQLVLDAAAGRMPAYVDTGLNIVHVDDVAAGHLLAFDRGRIGERYILGGEDMTLRQILAYIAGRVGRKPPRVRLPYATILALAYAAEAVAKITGRSGRVTLEGVRMSRKLMFFSSAKAARELGYRLAPARRRFRRCDRLVSRARSPVVNHAGAVGCRKPAKHERCRCARRPVRPHGFSRGDQNRAGSMR